jgi:hypothetical protein
LALLPIEFIERITFLAQGFEAKKRFGLSVLNYIVTCNHVHLLVRAAHPRAAASEDLRPAPTAQGLHWSAMTWLVSLTKKTCWVPLPV